MTRLLLLDVESGRFDPLGPEFAETAYGAAVSPDGARAAISLADGRLVLVRIDDGAVEAGPTLEPDESVIAFGDDGGSLLVERWGAASLRLDRVGIADGRRERWKELSPGDPTGLVLVFYARFARDNDAYAFAAYRILSDLYVVEGLG